MTETTTTASNSTSRRRLDLASLLLLLVGLGVGGFAYVLITEHGYDPLVMVPSVVAATVGASNIFVREAARS